MRHTVYKFKFHYKTEHGFHGPSTLEFIVSQDNGKLPKESDIEKYARAIMNDVGVLVENKSIPTYDFGTLSKDDFLDDVRKLAKIALKDYEVQLWFDRDENFAFWDDGDYKSVCPCGACSHG